MVTVWKYSCVIIFACFLHSSCLQEPDDPSLWGKKVDFLLTQCRFWQLSPALIIPELEEFTLCVDLRSKISTQDWTVFMYKRHGDTRPELGLSGMGGILQVWLFGREWPTHVTLPEDNWRSICMLRSRQPYQLRLYVNGDEVFSAYESNRDTTRRLAPNGTLSLGTSHGFTNGDMVPEDGTSFLGSVSVFRMWGHDIGSHQLSAHSCAEGDIIRWNARDWDMKECHAVPDPSLPCGDSSPVTPPVIMSSTKRQERQSTEEVSSLPPDVAETSVPVSTHMTLTSSVGHESDSFFRVSLNMTISDIPLDPQDIIQNWLTVTLEKHQMMVLNLKVTIPRHQEWMNPKVGEFSQPSSCSCTFQVQVTTHSDVGETKRLLHELLQQECDHGILCAELQSIQISLIEPGACLERKQQTRHGFYVWLQTAAQKTATLPCERDPNKAAVRLCALDAISERAKWSPADLRSCPLIIEAIPDLESIYISPENSMDVLEIITNLTRAQTSLSPPDLIILITKLEEIVAIVQVTPPLGSAIISIISSIMASDSDLSAVTNNILNITDNIGNSMIYSGEQYDVITPSLAVSLLNVNSSRFQGLSFGVSSILQDSGPEIFLNQEPFRSTVAFIYLPQAVGRYFPENAGIPSRVQFHFYVISDLFTDKWSQMELNTYVVSASVTNATIKDLEHPIFVTLQHRKPTQPKDKVQCVYWDFSKNDRLGGWESSGCRENQSSATHTTCFCNHLTHFGVLLDVSRTPVSEINEKILTVISYLGCGVSSIFLGISVLTYAAFGRLRRDYPSKILLNLSTALLGLNLVFLVNSWLSSFGSRGLCVAVAAAQHYSLLASFTWMGLEAVHMYFALVKVFNVYVPAYILKFCILGWGLPLVIVSLVLAVKMDAYGSALYHENVQPLDGSEQFCWLQDDVVFYVSVVAYVLLILLCNISVFVVVLVQLCNIQPPGSRTGLLHDLRGVTSLTFLLGLTWMMAFFTWGPAKVPLLYLFAILNSLQGFFIFVFYCLMKESVQKQWRIHLCFGRFRLAEHSDWSQTVTGGVKTRLHPLVHTPSVKSEKSDHSSSTSSSSGSTQCDQQPASLRRLTKGLSAKALVLPRAQFRSSPLSYPE
ncbi:adhesion G-protein coupled receptor G2-like isoform X2 [Brienomyrus brachyistius]|uniref:adhesion G-protein coupled receptor G2-like isoform X2 n=1 Tax=Brienomyrus brachyistius TaxID=42636 RepID=UPI0020B3CB07|nr:adhesion G-protein coupled receptor G2-like isoform X2 [Brienomyrus brachyistius]